MVHDLREQLQAVLPLECVEFCAHRRRFERLTKPWAGLCRVYDVRCTDLVGRVGNGSCCTSASMRLL